MMGADIKIIEEARKPMSMHPKKFALWLFIASVMMLFAAWTSAYIVKRSDVEWAEIILPNQFYINTIIIVLSSFTMIWAQYSARHNNLEKLKLAMSLTTLLGFGFLVGQVFAYNELIALKEYFTGGNVSHSFIYVISAAHAVHVVGGVVFLLVVLANAFKGKIKAGNMVKIEMCSTYWHFLGVLWVYLFVFLILNR